MSCLLVATRPIGNLSVRTRMKNLHFLQLSHSPNALILFIAVTFSFSNVKAMALRAEIDTHCFVSGLPYMGLHFVSLALTVYILTCTLLKDKGRGSFLPSIVIRIVVGALRHSYRWITFCGGMAGCGVSSRGRVTMVGAVMTAAATLMAFLTAFTTTLRGSKTFPSSIS